ncbi:MAG: hypothetical protein ACTHW2_10190 [Tissierella sp.]|uniref:hypothetical protein n=1 Tax=Tissierella sp. TaxID=41274 RepID=UPI003F98064D
MNQKYKNRNGSITIISLYIFILILTSSTMLLYFATLQTFLSKNQLEKIQSRYLVEDNLNRFIYDKENIEKYIEDRIFRTYRLERIPKGGIYNIKFEEGDKLKDDIQKASFRLEDMNGRKNIILSMDSKYKNINSNIVASGSCINQIFELRSPILTEEKLPYLEKELFLNFMDKIEKENVEYDCKLDRNSMKINTDEDVLLELVSNTPRDNKIFSEKRFVLDSDKNKEKIKFKYQSMILNLKRDKNEAKTLTIGNLDNKDLIKLNGVLYIEGDLVINQNLEFLGLIIINEGDIIINSLTKPKIHGAIYYKGKNIDTDKIDIIYNQDTIYKEGSFLPGFIDIKIDTIKKF